MNRTIVLASGNAGKLREIVPALAALGYEMVPQSRFGVADVEENGSTFLENALLKARHAARIAAMPALADDSGLEVDALAGAPGVHSARYAGTHADDAANRTKLLTALAGVPASQRRARFRCVMVYLRHAADPAPLVAEGVWEGSIAAEARGTNGFGYDPVFLLPERGCTAAELAPDEKNRLSHRAKALRTLIALLEQNGPDAKG